jgi:ribose transport system substrate-binding protein
MAWLRVDGPDAERARRGRYLVSVVLPRTDTPWSAALTRAIASALEEHGARIDRVIEAPDARSQIAALHALAREEPSAVISQPVGGAATSDAHRSLGRAGIRLVLLDEVPAGLLPERDHATVVGFDELGVGAMAAELLADAVPQGGAVGILGESADPLAGSERERGFRTWNRTQRPDLRLAAAHFGETGSPGGAALRLLAEDPGIAGLFVVRDDAAASVAHRLASAGHAVAVTTVDLGPEAAVQLAAGGMVVGVAARRPWEQGEAAATATILALLGRDVPDRITLPPTGVTRGDVLDAYREIWREVPPDPLVAARWSIPGTSSQPTRDPRG